MCKRLLILAIAVLCPMLVLLGLLNSHLQAAGGPAVLIDAVLYDGYESGDADEAVRIRNVSDGPVDISGWQVNDGESSTAVIPLTTTLASGQAIWLAKEGAAFQRQFGFAPDFERTDTLPSVPDLDGSWPSLANTGDQVLLRDAANALIDCLGYESNPDEDCGSGWVGTAVSPYTPNTSFASDGQILYRARDPQTGQPLPDSDRATDWAQGNADVSDGRKVQFPGWDLDQFFWTTQVTETAVLTIAIAPDNAYQAIVNQIASAQTSIQIETQTFENVGIADALLAARQRGVAVTILMEAEPAGGVSDQERYICQLLADAGAHCWFMFNESNQDIFDRYTFLHAKFILIDGQRVLISQRKSQPTQSAR
ncbi:MAG: hypothetical protein HC804_12380 [Anaerolineae bacterium]|nr:hypothetical protein [Anaerolineae bacterium]